MDRSCFNFFDGRRIRIENRLCAHSAQEVIMPTNAATAPLQVVQMEKYIRDDLIVEPGFVSN